MFLMKKLDITKSKNLAKGRIKMYGKSTILQLCTDFSLKD